MNRILVNNCGMTGDSLAQILIGVTKLVDFKALTYKQGMINQLAIERLVPIMVRPVPNHFEELSLIDVRISPTLIEKLMGLLLSHSRIKKIALVSL